jgi:hypothetical protein
MRVIRRNELPGVVGDPTSNVRKSREISLDFSGFFNDEAAQKALELRVSDLINENNVILKSMYDFDVETEQGVYKLLALLPILDPDIVKVVIQEIWPGYPVDAEYYSNSIAKAEIRGYLLDFLEGHGTQPADIESTDEGEPDGGAETPEPSPEPA